MDPRLNRHKLVNATGRGVDPKSPVQDARKHSTANSPDTGSGGSTPLHFNTADHGPHLSLDDAHQLEKAFLKLATKSGACSIYRKKRDYLREQSEISSGDFKRAEQTAAQFPVILEQARLSQTRIDSTLERTEKTLRDNTAAEASAAQDVVRLLFGFMSRDMSKTKNLENQVETMKREYQDTRTQLVSANTTLKAVAAENESLKIEIAAMKDNSVNMTKSINTLRQENSEQISKFESRLKELQGLPDDLDSLRKQLCAEKERATERARTFDTRIEDLGREMSKKGSQLAIKGLESQIQPLKAEIQVAEQSRGQMAADIITLQGLKTTPHPNSKGIDSLELDQVSKDLTKQIGVSKREWKDEIEALRVQTKQAHVSTTLAQLQSLNVLVDTHSKDIELIRGEFSTLLSNVDEKIDHLAQNKAVTAHGLQLAAVQNQLSSIEAQYHKSGLAEFSDRITRLETRSTNADSITVSRHAASDQDDTHVGEELRSMLEALKQETDDQFLESHELITQTIEQMEKGNRENIEKLQGQVEVLEKLSEARVISAKSPTEADEASNATSMLSQQIEELGSQLKTLQAKPTGHERIASIDGQLQTLKNQILDLDKTLTTLMRAQMSSQDREVLESAKTLSARMEKQEHQHQWLRTRFDNLTTESLYRQIIGYVAPSLPQFEQGLIKMDRGMETLQTKVTQISTRLEASTSDLSSRVQLLEDNLAAASTKSQQQHATLAKEFEEARHRFFKQFTDLESWKTEYEEHVNKLSGIAKNKVQDGKDRNRVDLGTRSTRDSSTPHNRIDQSSPGLRGRSTPQSTPAQPRPARPVSSQGASAPKASEADWVADSESSDDELSASDEGTAKSLLRSFQKPNLYKASTPSDRATPNDSTPSSSTPKPTSTPKSTSTSNEPVRKRKRGNALSKDDKGRTESESENLKPARKRAQGK